MRLVLQFSCFALAAPGFACAPMTGSAEPPQWTRWPNPPEVARAVSAHVKAVGFVGNAVLRCRITPEGALTACTVVSESHRGLGLGAAALSLAPLFRLDPARVAPGGTVEASVRLPAPAP